MTNDLEATEKIFHNADYDMMPLLGVARTVKRELRKLHNLWQIWSISSAHGAVDMQNQHAATALPHINLLARN
jgi:hypothetical protein